MRSVCWCLQRGEGGRGVTVGRGRSRVAIGLPSSMSRSHRGRKVLVEEDEQMVGINGSEQMVNFDSSEQMVGVYNS